MPSGLAKPPSEATASAFTVKISPMCGCTVTSGPTRMPETAASSAASTQTITTVRRTSMPSSAADSGLKATAYTSLPQRLRNRNQ
jgi:hypothetical protein